MYNDKLLPVLQDIETVMETDPRCKEVKKAVVAEIDKRLMLCEDPARKPGSAMYVDQGSLSVSCFLTMVMQEC
jgi:hypothetical protein